MLRRRPLRIKELTLKTRAATAKKRKAVKKQQMMINGENKFERKSLSDRIKEISSLSIFTIIVALAGVALMDVIVYPLVSFAVKDVNTFNIIFENLFFLFILSFLIYTLVRKIRKLTREEAGRGQVLMYLLRRPFHYITLTLFILVLSSAVIFILYTLFSQNYYYLYKISNGL